MVRLAMDAPAMTIAFAQVAAWLVLGAVLGVIQLAALRHNVTVLSTGSSAILPIGLFGLRFAVLAAALAAIVILFGAMPLLLTLVGLTATRALVLGRG